MLLDDRNRALARAWRRLAAADAVRPPIIDAGPCHRDARQVEQWLPVPCVDPLANSGEPADGDSPRSVRPR